MVLVNNFMRNTMPVSRFSLLLMLAGSFFVASCSVMPQSGPTTRAFSEEMYTLDRRIKLINLTPELARQMQKARVEDGFAKIYLSTELNPEKLSEPKLGIGDSLEVNIWEAPPATLFSGADQPSRNSTLSGARGITLPEQAISSEGTIRVPFAGDIKAKDRVPSAVATDIAQALKGKAHQPQVLVRLIRGTSALVTVIGEVGASSRVTLTARHERILDAIAAAGGSKQSIQKTTIQLTRGSITASMPLDRIIKEPKHNIILNPGDILTAIYQPLSFTALGATNQNVEINFEAQGISLAQALARIGGLQDNRADPQGVFLFRMEDLKKGALTVDQSDTKNVVEVDETRTPVVYQIDLRRPESFFTAQAFMLENKDLLYISNAPAADWQKFANLVYTIALPTLNTIKVVN